MILPTKRLPEDRALLAVGADVVRSLDQPKTVSRLWNELTRERETHHGSSPVTFDWFVLALDLLYTIGALELERGPFRRARS